MTQNPDAKLLWTKAWQKWSVNYWFYWSSASDHGAGLPNNTSKGEFRSGHLQLSWGKQHKLQPEKLIACCAAAKLVPSWLTVVLSLFTQKSPQYPQKNGPKMVFNLRALKYFEWIWQKLVAGRVFWKSFRRYGGPLFRNYEALIY